MLFGILFVPEPLTELPALPLELDPEAPVPIELLEPIEPLEPLPMVLPLGPLPMLPEPPMPPPEPPMPPPDALAAPPAAPPAPPPPPACAKTNPGDAKAAVRTAAPNNVVNRRTIASIGLEMLERAMLALRGIITPRQK